MPMRRLIFVVVASVALSLLHGAGPAGAGARPAGRGTLPASSALPGRALAGAAIADPLIIISRTASVTPTGYSPAQMRHAYGFDQDSQDGSGQIIAIPIFFDDTTVASDLQTFITQFGLSQLHGLSSTDPCTVAAGPHPCFQVVNAQSTKPPANAGWAGEDALDTQWAHAIAPGADILSIEMTPTLTATLAGIDTGPQMGASVVSMSWVSKVLGPKYNSHFDQPATTFVASNGDHGSFGVHAAAHYPSASSYVLAVGGTHLELDATGNVITETAWQGDCLAPPPPPHVPDCTGGGLNLAEPEPSYQTAWQSSGNRAVPDVAYNADAQTGVSVYLGAGPAPGHTGWYVIGGNSAGAPQWAGLMALANEARVQNHKSVFGGNGAIHGIYLAAEVPTTPGEINGSLFNDITVGSNGTCGSLCNAAPNYDFVTGLGSPHANNLVFKLAHE